MTMQEHGLKYDEGKNRLGLVLGGFANGLKEVGRIGTFGANKYKPNSWQTIENPIERYTDALFRHLLLGNLVRNLIMKVGIDI